MQERGEYLCGNERGEGSRGRSDLICCEGGFVSPQNGHMRITAGLRCAPHFVRRLAFGNPLGGHGGCREAGAQPPVPASQVRKPACRYTQWPFWGEVLAGWGSRSKTRNDLVVPAGNGGYHSRSSEEMQFIPAGHQDGIFPSSRLLLVRQIDPHPMPPRRQLSWFDPGSQT